VTKSSLNGSQGLLLGWILLTVTALFISVVVATIFQKTELVDLHYYLAAAQRSQQGITPYGEPYLTKIGTDPLLLRYFYPPLLITILELIQASHSLHFEYWWLFFSCLSNAGGSLFLMRAFRPGLPAVRRTIVLIAISLSPWALEGYYFGQIDSFVFFLLTATCFATRNEKFVLAGCALGLAVALKMSPIILIIPLLVHGNHRTVMACGLTVIGSFLLAVLSQRGLALLADWFESLATIQRDNFFWNLPENASLARMLVQMFSIAPWLARTLTLTVAVLLGIIVSIRFRKVSADRLVIPFAAFVSLMIIASPIVWYHHLLWATIPITAGCVFSKSVPSRFVIGACTISLIISMPVNVYVHEILHLNFLGSREMLGPALTIAPLLILTLLLARIGATPRQK